MVGKNIASLRTGTPVGVVSEAIINPHNLKVDGWHAIELPKKRQGILLAQDIRDILPQGFIVDDHDAISEPGELIRLKEILKLNFQLIGKSVIDENRKRLGKVSDYAIDKDTFDVSKIHVAQSVFRSFKGGALLIDKSQVVEVNPHQIIVKQTANPLESELPATVPAS